MELHWGQLSTKSRAYLKTAWLITASVVALYIGAIGPMNSIRSAGMAQSTGLAGLAWEPVSLWRARTVTRITDSLQAGVVGGVPGGARLETGSVAKSAAYVSANDEQKIVTTASIDLVVRKPQESAEAIRDLAVRFGGSIVNAQTYGEDALGSSLTIRVPKDQFEMFRPELKKLGLRVESERLEAQDVTRQYVDESARLRNLRAQETQYLGILTHAKNVKDTLDVSEKINEVRAEIEQQQAEFSSLSMQVETVAMTISLRGEADMQVFGVHWRPLYRAKLSAREGLEAIADYSATMLSLVFYLPSVLLWLATLLLLSAIGWRILRWAARLLFVPRRAAA